METLSRKTRHFYPYSTIRYKLTKGGEIDWPFIETIVTVGHRYARLPGEPDLDSWRRKYEQARLHQHWVGSTPSVADSYQTRRIGIELSGDFTPGRTFVLTGLGGVGKTQLAVDLVHRSWVDHQVDLVVWVAAISRTTMVSAFAEAAAKIGVAGHGDEEAAGRRFLAWLTEEHGRRWLVVLDDVRDPADLRGLWPPTGNGNTVVTTRGRQAAFAGSGRRIITVDVFEPSESISYMRDKLNDEEFNGAAQLADALGHLPLALAQAAAYIRDAGRDCADYLHRFREGRLADVEPDSLPDEHAAVVASTWNLSITAADAHRPVGVGRPLLELAALLSPNGIPTPAFTTTAVQALLTKRRGRATTADDAWDGLSNLKLLNLCGLDDDRRTVRVHQLVQRAVREAWPGRRAETAISAADALLEIWPEVERDATLVDVLRNNTDALHRNTGDALWHGKLHQVMFRAGNSLTLRGLPLTALAYWEGLLPTALDRLGTEHPDTLKIRNNLAWARHRTGASDRALEDMRELLTVRQRVLTVRQRVLGADHPNTLATMHGIAEFQAATGDIDGAITLLRGLLADYEQVLGPDERDTLNTRLLLAVMLGETESADVAVHQLRTLLDDYRRNLGPDDPETLNIESKLSGWLVDAGKIDEARSRIERLAGGYERALGPDHIDTLRMRYNAAVLHAQDGRRAEAAGELRELLDDVQRLLEQGRTEVEEIREWIEQWSADEGDAD